MDEVIKQAHACVQEHGPRTTMLGKSYWRKATQESEELGYFFQSSADADREQIWKDWISDGLDAG